MQAVSFERKATNVFRFGDDIDPESLLVIGIPRL